jgi:hypothetical protein
MPAAFIHLEFPCTICVSRISEFVQGVHQEDGCGNGEFEIADMTVTVMEVRFLHF